MIVPNAKRQSSSKEGTRASVTFPGELYSALERIAEEKKVSVAWVVRDAVEKYVDLDTRFSPSAFDAASLSVSGRRS